VAGTVPHRVEERVATAASGLAAMVAGMTAASRRWLASSASRRAASSATRPEIPDGAVLAPELPICAIYEAGEGDQNEHP